MMENDKVEFKESWRDEYLKVIAGFANSDGGTLYIGYADNGEVVGVTEEQAKRLLEELPNKIRNKLRITPKVLEEHFDGKIVIKIDVLRSDQLVALDGRYYFRSGSTTQELTESELKNLLLERTDKTWDSFPVEGSLNG